MKAVAVFFVLCGLLALYYGLFHSGQSRDIAEAKTQVLAINYAVFRNAAHQYVHHNQTEALAMTEIPRTSFEKWLPNGWLPMRDWKVRLENRSNQWVCYVFGPAEPDEIDAIRKLYRGSFALGRAEGGQLVPNHGGDMPVPDWIPNGNVVSMTEVRP